MAGVDPIKPLLAVGTEVAGYRVEAFISRGGMAVVYRAHDRRLGRRVALKLLAPELSQDERFQQRFLRESRLAASLDHPNIIPIYEAGESRGLLYIVMRYVEGSDLQAVLDQDGPLPLPRLASILSQVGAALDAAHARGLVHRDVKPGNILIASGAGREDPDHVYLTDFGLTKRSSSVSGLTTTGHFIGTMDYIAPEQIGSKPVDARTDIYSLGCVLYQCLTGDPPFDRDDEAALLWAHLVERPPPVSGRRPGVPPGVDAVVAKAMAKAPEDRHGSCRELVAEFQAAVQGQAEPRPPAPAPGPPPSAPAKRPGGRRSASTPPVSGRRGLVVGGFGGRRPGNLAVLLAAVVTLAVVATGVFMFTRGGERLSASFAKDQLVPFSFRYPGGWHKHGSSVQVVFSPYAAELFPLFGRTGTGDGWGAVEALLDRSPADLAGLYTFFGSTQYRDNPETEELEQGLAPLLPERVSFTPTHERVQVGGYPADRLEGDLRDPSRQGTSLHFLCQVVHVQDPEPKTVYLLFFAPPDSFEAQRDLFDRITATVSFQE
jgi:tRNA A-37 threonylcarbamoyl transferase component Bud32